MIAPSVDATKAATSFLGREVELAEGERLLERARLLTITGPGGVGKTRFALELARRVGDRFDAGVSTCLFASLRDPSLVLPTIARALDVAEEPGRTALDALSRRLEKQHMLLVLDNLEHLSPAAAELAELHARAPGLTLVCTSRERLRVEGERPYVLPPLTAADGVALFCERARVEPSGTIAELCRRLEGLPLAIELAAARLRLLSPEQLLERLVKRLDVLKGARDADPRQQTLRATIQWSYDLLDPKEQGLLARISVFAGGFTLRAAQEVCDAVPVQLDSLVDRSLLGRTESESRSRFWALETVREYAEEQLEALDERVAIRQRHALYFAAVAASAAAALERSGAGHWLDLLDAEEDNMRAALVFARETGQADLSLRLVGGVGYYWYIRGRLLEGRGWADWAVGAATTRDLPTARALVAAAALASATGEHDLARRYAREALSMLREHGETDISLVLSGLGVLAHQRGELEAAARLFEEAAASAREAGNRFQLGIAVANLGDISLAEGHLSRSLAYTDEALAVFRELGSTYGCALAASNRAFCLFHMSRHEECLEAVAESLTLMESGEDTRLVYCGATIAAAVAARRGDHGAAACLLGSADAIRRGTGWSPTPVDSDLHTATAQAVLGALGRDRFGVASSEGQALPPGGVVRLVLEAAGAQRPGRRAQAAGRKE